MNPWKLIKFVLLLFISGSCLTPVDIELENQAGGITIYGQVSNYGRRNFVEVGLTAGTSRKPIGISTATVFLNDSNGNTFQYQKSPVAGRYLLPNFVGTPGRTYWIEVRLSSGEIITSDPDTMPLDVGEDEISWDFSDDLLTDADGQVTELHWLNIRAKPTLPPGKKLFLRWSVDEIYVIFPTDFPDPFGTIPPSCYVTSVTDG